MKVNQSLELPQRESQSLPTKKRKVVLFSSMYSFKWRKLLGMFANTSMRNLWQPVGEARWGMVGREWVQAVAHYAHNKQADPIDRPFVQGRGFLCSLLTGQDLELGQAPRNSVLQTSIARWLLVLLYAAISCRALYQSTNMGIESKDRGGKTRSFSCQGHIFAANASFAHKRL